MCKTRCLLIFAALSINLVNSWDIAVTTGDQLEFYTNHTRTHLEQARFRELTALAYDAVHNMLLFVDKQNDNASIFSYHLATKKYQPLVGRRSNENIQGLDFDPVSGKLFWTDTYEKSIFWILLWPERPKNDLYGNLLIKMDDEIPRGIVVDSCRGYIYWTNINITKPTIERARLDGSERKVIVDTNIHSPVSLALDQRTKRLYWADDREGIYYTIESSDLEGQDRKTLLHGTEHRPNSLSVSNDFIYWVDWGYKTVWKIPKDSELTNPVKVVLFTEPPFGIVAHYQVENQSLAIPECTNLNNLLLNKSSFNDSFNIPEDVGLFCLHGDKVADKYSTCKCFPGYTGIRCEISVCQNFCLNGDCSSTPEGNPSCKCKPGFSGARCQMNVCDGYCLHNGECSLDGSTPICRCANEFEGERCETRIVETTTFPPHVPEPCNDTKNNSMAVLRDESLLADEGLYENTSCSGWDPLRDPVLMVLGFLCCLLLLTCAVLITKILQLKKRPRIKKRIIVNRNVTPLTARPDQCEITIENCCNMNICETSEESTEPNTWISLKESILGVFPCFEPRNTIRPTLLDAKPVKDEKKNLIANMETPDDLY